MGRWVVSRYDDIVFALHNPDIFSSEPVIPPFPTPFDELLRDKVPGRGTLIGHDNPTHDRLRKAVNTFFIPRRLARYESWIEAQAHELIDGFYELGRADFREVFSSPLPLKVISHIVGVDPANSADYRHALLFFGEFTPERAQPLIEFHELITRTIEARRTDRRDDLISHVWNMRDSGEAVMTDFEMLSLFPGLMLAGHETSANLIVMALSHLLARPSVYEAAQRDDDTRVRAIEEALRFEAPITGMPRRVTRPVTLGGTELDAGDEVFLAFASGNRDAKHFGDGDEFDLEHWSTTQHIGFGQGVHACLGAPLARLLLKVEMRVIAERLPGLRFGRPYAERSYAPVREVRAFMDAPFEWDVLDSHVAKIGSYPKPSEIADDSGWLNARVSARREVALGVVELTLSPVDGVLPKWTAGAHAEIEFLNGLIRQYSLCGGVDDAEWKVAVQLEADGRGGSRFVHQDLRVGNVLRVKPPRNHFQLQQTEGAVLIAGGIGITPFLPMIETLQSAGADWKLVYLGRTRAAMSYADELEATFSDRVQIHASDQAGRFDLEGYLRSLNETSMVYCCGPERLMNAVEGFADGFGLSVRAERFKPGPTDDIPNEPFQAVLRSSGRSIEVGAAETLLQALAREGVHVLSTCQEGTCGSCEVDVLEGQVLHRDWVLSPEDKATNESMMVCVSRCRGARLVLDL